MLILWKVMTLHKGKCKWQNLLKVTNIALVNDTIHEKINKGREDSHANILSWTSFMIVSPHQVFYVKVLLLDKEDNIMNYVCSYSHRNYIVIDPPTCGACPISLLATNPHQVEILLVHPRTLNPISCHESPLYLPMD